MGTETQKRHREAWRCWPIARNCQGVSGPGVRYHRGRENEDLDEESSCPFLQVMAAEGPTLREKFRALYKENTFPA